jgi:hypothetical protein
MAITRNVTITFSSFPKPNPAGDYPDGSWGVAFTVIGDATGGNLLVTGDLAKRHQLAKWMFMCSITINTDGGAMTNCEAHFKTQGPPGGGLAATSLSGQSPIWMNIPMTLGPSAGRNPDINLALVKGWISLAMPAASQDPDPTTLILWRIANTNAVQYGGGAWGFWWDRSRLEKLGITPKVPY